MLSHRAEKDAADKLTKSMENVNSDKANHTPDLGGTVATRKVTDAVIKAVRDSAH